MIPTATTEAPPTAAEIDDAARIEVAELLVLPLGSDATAEQLATRWREVRERAVRLDATDPALVRKRWYMERAHAADVEVMPTTDGIRMRRASRITPEAVRWVYDGRIPLAATTLVVGAPGDGKSTMLVDLAARLTRGTLAGCYAGTPVSVAIATAEDAAAAVVVPRLMAAGADLARVRLIDVARDGITGTLTLDPATVADLGDLVRAAGVRLLVLDPLVAMLPGTIDTHRDAAVRQILAPLATLAETAELAVVAVIHLNKSQVQDVLYRVSGSIGFVGAARSVLLLTHDPDDPDGPTRVLAHAKCNLGPHAVTQRMQLVGHELERGTDRIKTSCIKWIGDAPDLRPADLLATSSADDRSALDEAVDWLRETLSAAKTGLDAKAAVRDAKGHGIAERTLRRARERLGVVVKHNGRTKVWSWHLPSDDGATWPTSEFGHLAPGDDDSDGITTRSSADSALPSKVANGKMADPDGHLAPGDPLEVVG